MEMVSLVVQAVVGAVLTMYGSYLLLQYRKKRMQLTGKYVLSFVCILVGVVLLGSVFGQTV